MQAVNIGSGVMEKVVSINILHAYILLIKFTYLILRIYKVNVDSNAMTLILLTYS